MPRFWLYAFKCVVILLVEVHKLFREIAILSCKTTSFKIDHIITQERIMSKLEENLNEAIKGLVQGLKMTSPLRQA